MRGTQRLETSCGMASLEPGPCPGSQGTVGLKERPESIRMVYTGGGIVVVVWFFM